MSTEILSHLSKIAPELKRTKSTLDTHNAAIRELETTALAAVREQYVNIYDQRDAAKLHSEALEAEARTLLLGLNELEDTTGTVADGMYQITAPQKLGPVEGVEEQDIVHYILQWLPSLAVDFPILRVDYRALDEALDGRIPNVLKSLGEWLAYTPQIGTRIMWSKLPDTEDVNEPEAEAEAVAPDPSGVPASEAETH